MTKKPFFIKEGNPTTLRPLLYTREPVTQFYFITLCRFYPGFLTVGVQ